MGVVIPVAPAELAGHEAAIQAEGLPDYQVKPAGERDSYSSVIFIEPFDWRNQRALGYDMSTEPVWRAAMDRAIDTGLPVVSGRITLVQETEKDPQHGFLYLLPMYDSNLVQNNASDRRNAFRGFVYSAFRANDLMEEIIAQQPDGLEFEIYDSASPSPDKLLYDSDAESHFDQPDAEPEFSRVIDVQTAGRSWSIYFESRSGFVRAGDGAQSLTVAFGGLLIDLLLFVVIASIGRQRKNALLLARQMTREFREKEQFTRSVLANATEAVIAVDQDGTIDLFNEAAEEMFLLPVERALGSPFSDLLANDDWPALLRKSRLTF